MAHITGLRKGREYPMEPSNPKIGLRHEMGVRYGGKLGKGEFLSVS